MDNHVKASCINTTKLKVHGVIDEVEQRKLVFGNAGLLFGTIDILFRKT